MDPDPVETSDSEIEMSISSQDLVRRVLESQKKIWSVQSKEIEEQFLLREHSSPEPVNTVVKEENLKSSSPLAGNADLYSLFPSMNFTPSSVPRVTVHVETHGTTTTLVENGVSVEIPSASCVDFGKMTLFQTSVLDRAFDQSPYPMPHDIDRLSKLLCTNPRHIQRWFAHKRKKKNKEDKDVNMERGISIGELVPIIKEYLPIANQVARKLESRSPASKTVSVDEPSSSTSSASPSSSSVAASHPQIAPGKTLTSPMTLDPSTYYFDSSIKDASSTSAASKETPVVSRVGELPPRILSMPNLPSKTSIPNLPSKTSTPLLPHTPPSRKESGMTMEKYAERMHVVEMFSKKLDSTGGLADDRYVQSLVAKLSECQTSPALTYLLSIIEKSRDASVMHALACEDVLKRLHELLERQIETNIEDSLTLLICQVCNRIPFHIKLLAKVRIGKLIRKLKKSSNSDVSNLCSKIEARWTHMLEKKSERSLSSSASNPEDVSTIPYPVSNIRSSHLKDNEFSITNDSVGVEKERQIDEQKKSSTLGKRTASDEGADISSSTEVVPIPEEDERGDEPAEKRSKISSDSTKTTTGLMHPEYFDPRAIKMEVDVTPPSSKESDSSDAASSSGRLTTSHDSTKPMSREDLREIIAERRRNQLAAQRQSSKKEPSLQSNTPSPSTSEPYISLVQYRGTMSSSTSTPPVLPSSSSPMSSAPSSRYPTSMSDTLSSHLPASMVYSTTTPSLLPSSTTSSSSSSFSTSLSPSESSSSSSQKAPSLGDIASFAKLGMKTLSSVLSSGDTKAAEHAAQEMFTTLNALNAAMNSGSKGLLKRPGTPKSRKRVSWAGPNELTQVRTFVSDHLRSAGAEEDIDSVTKLLHQMHEHDLKNGKTNLSASQYEKVIEAQKRSESKRQFLEALQRMQPSCPWRRPHKLVVSSTTDEEPIELGRGENSEEKTRQRQREATQLAFMYFSDDALPPCPSGPLDRDSLADPPDDSSIQTIPLGVIPDEIASSAPAVTVTSPSSNPDSNPVLLLLQMMLSSSSSGDQRADPTSLLQLLNLLSSLGSSSSTPTSSTPLEGLPPANVSTAPTPFSSLPVSVGAPFASDSGFSAFSGTSYPIDPKVNSIPSSTLASMVGNNSRLGSPSPHLTAHAQNFPSMTSGFPIGGSGSTVSNYMPPPFGVPPHPSASGIAHSHGSNIYMPAAPTPSVGLTPTEMSERIAAQIQQMHGVRTPYPAPPVPPVPPPPPPSLAPFSGFPPAFPPVPPSTIREAGRGRGNRNSN